ncbi:MAG TPA: RdgB/HAM1 family non-canonical purine NTP pyrophosphatase [Firmicutes bacterium]|nr:RdgB/HAM1 family non-canonical purine NTP pyrophosphatase [Bacillota bacterium]
MSPLDIILATKNADKIKEIRSALVLPGIRFIENRSLLPAVEDGATFVENALIKARKASEQSGKAALADDSGLQVDALQGAPGIYSARFAGENASDRENNEKLLKLMRAYPEKGREGQFYAAVVLYFPSGEWIHAEGSCRGLILESPRGGGGFGYDPLFYLPSLKKTMAELTLEEKNALSHRSRALSRLREKLFSEEFRSLLNITP